MPCSLGESKKLKDHIRKKLRRNCQRFENVLGVFWEPRVEVFSSCCFLPLLRFFVRLGGSQASSLDFSSTDSSALYMWRKIGKIVGDKYRILLIETKILPHNIHNNVNLTYM